MIEWSSEWYVFMSSTVSSSSSLSPFFYVVYILTRRPDHAQNGTRTTHPRASVVVGHPSHRDEPPTTRVVEPPLRRRPRPHRRPGRRPSDLDDLVGGDGPKIYPSTERALGRARLIHSRRPPPGTSHRRTQNLPLDETITRARAHYRRSRSRLESHVESHVVRRLGGV